MVAPLWQLSVSSLHMVKRLTLADARRLGLLNKTPNQPKFRQNRLKNASDIHNQKVVLPGKMGLGHVFFCHRQKRDYLSRASLQQRARGATKNTTNRKWRQVYLTAGCALVHTAKPCYWKYFLSKLCRDSPARRRAASDLLVTDQLDAILNFHHAAVRRNSLTIC